MARNTEELSPKQEALIAALLLAPSVADAARVAGVPHRTAKRWLALPHVRRAWLDARRQVVDAAMLTVQTSARVAVATLLACLKPTHPASVRVRAAATLLETAIRAVEVGDLAARIDELEALLAAYQDHQDHQDRAPLTPLEARRYA